MSLLSPDRYVAVLGGSAVGLSRQRGKTREWLGSVSFIGERFPAWPLAIDTLECMLREHVRGRAELCVALSSHYCRFCLVPWSEQIVAPAELQEYARFCFDEVYGPPEEQWTLCISPEAAGQPRLAAALPEALLEALRGLAGKLGVRLEGVQPYLMAAFNRFARSLPQKDYLFVVAEPSRSTLLLAGDNRWGAVRSLGVADTDEALDELIARECELRGGDDAAEPLNVFLHAPGRFDDTPQLAGVEVLTLQLPHAGVRDVLYSMAMAVN
ncbi:hypothetical protein [Pseudomonas jinjuensis]|uniref:Uncharacterized protein n=1 Tax=Pseudomonas jinjuensis TaxID=198616 RepID=A0A1G9Z6Y6_9PSED|nr:hypothetical protein [Pseudomonas jinjuensis]SDN16531.1 hypothetical protein SAMN05216193_101363 [Pseudomonas jinjuensis]